MWQGIVACPFPGGGKDKQEAEARSGLMLQAAVS